VLKLLTNRWPKYMCTPNIPVTTREVRVTSTFYPLVLSFAIENLKMMVSPSTVAVASVQEAEKFKNMVTYFEQVTFRFFILVEEVEALSYSTRLSGAFF
jgi:hypothetical protein